jgi:small nuclear ribonucleoprotein (snRNP)-like protein
MIESIIGKGGVIVLETDAGVTIGGTSIDSGIDGFLGLKCGVIVSKRLVIRAKWIAVNVDVVNRIFTPPKVSVGDSPYDEIGQLKPCKADSKFIDNVYNKLVTLQMRSGDIYTGTLASWSDFVILTNVKVKKPKWIEETIFLAAKRNQIAYAYSSVTKKEERKRRKKAEKVDTELA